MKLDVEIQYKQEDESKHFAVRWVFFLDWGDHGSISWGGERKFRIKALVETPMFLDMNIRLNQQYVGHGHEAGGLWTCSL